MVSRKAEILWIFKCIAQFRNIYCKFEEECSVCDSFEVGRGFLQVDSGKRFSVPGSYDVLGPRGGKDAKQNDLDSRDHCWHQQIPLLWNFI